ncbi:MAG: ABC transporter ATP-binding protein [Flavobacteriaceae bacterium]|nr:ABC transporter ATP-binding protein [Flavobacteriaceae bacterium]
MLIKTTNLDIGYASKKRQNSIAQNINIEITSPKLICLIGENGIGKSTLLRTLSKVQPKLKGEIIINNKNLNHYTAATLSQKIGLVLTEKVPPSNLTVYELIALGRQTYTNWVGTLTDLDKQKIEVAINLCNMIDFKHQKIDELSDGQYQKMMLARVLAQDTPIILLDEPTAHLDINNKIEIFKLLKNLVENENKLIIISTHELQLALHTSNDLWIMTNKEFLCNTVKNHIENGNLDKIVKSKLVKFDKLKKGFVFK